MNLDLLWQKEQRLLDGIVERLVPDGERYLDFACGTGRILRHCRPKVQSSTGVDVSVSMLEIARKESPSSKIICADLTTATPLDSQLFELITAIFDRRRSIHYWAIPPRRGKNWDGLRRSVSQSW